MAQKRNSVSDRQKKVIRPVDAVLFNKKDDIQTNIQENIQASKHVNIQTNELKRQTYYLSEDIIKALKLYSAFEDKDKSKTVRQALKEFIPDKYFGM